MVSSVKDVDSAGRQLVGKAALIASVGGQQAFADWTSPAPGCGACWPSSSAWRA